MTSCVFGEMRHLPTSDIWAFFSRLVPAGKRAAINWSDDTPDKAEFHFWRRGKVEPDLCIDFFRSGVHQASLLIEIKWDASLSPKCEKGKGNRKAYGQLGVHLAFHNENYSKNDGWEPTLFVLYAPDDSQFSLESIDHILREEFICPQDDRVWRWKKEGKASESMNSWMFAVPLVAINNGKDIHTKIVSPAKALLSDPENSRTALACDKSFFRFQWTGETFSMSI